MATTEQAVFIPGEPIDDVGLKAIIAMEMENALGIDGGKLSNSRRDALKQYEGEKYGNEVDGRSQVVDRTIMETVEWILPALMRIFASADKIVSVDPQRPEDEEVARQQTEYLNYVFMRDNPGFMILYTWFKDALLQKLGWVQAYWDVTRKTENEKYSGLTEEQYQALIEDPDVEVVEKKQYPAWGPERGLVHAEDMREGAQPMAPSLPLSPLAPKPMNGAAPPMPPPMLWDCTLRRTYNEGRLCNENVAPEEVLISRRATPGYVPFLCRRRRKTRSELIEAGYDYDTVMTLSPFDEQEYNTERIQRFFKNDEWPYRSARTDAPMVEVWINECYLSVDMEGDGIAKLRKVVVGGDKTYTILGNELIDEVPLHQACPIPMPHTLVGLSLADLVGDLQLIKTTLWRQTLDNLYLTNNPRHYVNEDATTENTYDDLLTSRPGSIVRGRGPQEQSVVPLVTPFVAGNSFQMLSYLDEQAEKRSGISKGNQGIAPDDLNKNAAVGSMGVGMLQEAAAQRVELIARIFAESVRELFKANLGLIIRNQQDPRIVKLTGNWTPVDPASWRKQYELSVAVGLGTGNRDKMIQQINQIMTWQVQAITLQGSANGPLVTMENLYRTAKLLATSMGFKDESPFISDPARAPPAPPPKPDPQIQVAQIRAQADLQTKAQDREADAQKTVLEFAMRERLGRYEIDRKMQLEAARFGLDVAQFNLEHEKTAHEIVLKHADHNLKRETAAMPQPKSPGSLPEGPRV